MDELIPSGNVINQHFINIIKNELSMLLVHTVSDKITYYCGFPTCGEGFFKDKYGIKDKLVCSDELKLKLTIHDPDLKTGKKTKVRVSGETLIESYDLEIYIVPTAPYVTDSFVSIDSDIRLSQSLIDVFDRKLHNSRQGASIVI